MGSCCSGSGDRDLEEDRVLRGGDLKFSRSRHYPTNYIRTNRYRWWLFLFVNLWEQFHKPANAFFLVNMLIAVSFPHTSPITPATSVLPLLFVVGIALAKDGIEDFFRYRADVAANSAPQRLLRDGVVMNVPSAEVHVGDMVFLGKDQVICADMVLLTSSCSKANGQEDGICFVDTAQLDGETNLKTRAPVHAPLALLLRTVDAVTALVDGTLPLESIPHAPSTGTHQPGIHVTAEAPSETLSKWDGKVQLRSAGEGSLSSEFPVDLDNMLLRGSVVRNTDSAVGVVVYSGRDTKLFRNLTPKATKVSVLQHKLNRVVLALMLLSQFIVTICSALHTFNSTHEIESAWYISYYYEGEKAGVTFVFSYFTFFILMSYMLPISLFVSMEFCKAFQVKLMEWDDLLSDADRRTPLADNSVLLPPNGAAPPLDDWSYTQDEAVRRTVAKTSSLNEELATIDVLFCDKTGTLTENVMAFHSCFTGWPLGVTSLPMPDGSSIPVDSPGSLIATYRAKESVGALTRCFWDDETGDWTRGAGQVAGMLLTTMATANNVLVATKHADDGMPAPKPRRGSSSIALTHNDDELGVSYEGTSTDEVALVEGAAGNRVRLLRRTADTVSVVQPDGSVQRWRMAASLPFTSDRKRMTAMMQLVRDDDVIGPDGFANGTPIVILTKGADVVMLPRLVNAPSPMTTTDVNAMPHVPPFLATCLCDSIAAGLRCLVVGYRVMSVKDFREWKTTHWDAASMATSGRDEKKAVAAALVETDLYPIGVTGVEDQLQDGVPESVAWLLDAGIVVWILTGDHGDTALNISVHARLYDPSRDKLLRVSGKQPGEVSASLNAALDAVRTAPPPDKRPGRLCVAVEGPSLEAVFRDDRLLDVFRELGKQIDCGICSRMMPLQKAQVVGLFKKRGQVVAAIGDGANDVSMIQEARVGIGIMGLEGSQAERASDYAIPRYRHVVRLIAVHGRACWVRNTMLIQFSFYKNVTLAIVVLLFNTRTYFSGMIPIDAWVMTMYNILFLFFPPLFLAATDKDLPDRTVLAHPPLYRQIRDGANFTHGYNVAWVISSIADAVIVYYVTSFSWDEGRGIAADATTLATALVFTGLLRAALVLRTWTFPQFVAIFGSMVIYWGFIFVLSSMRELFGETSYYLAAHDTFTMVNGTGRISYPWAAAVLPIGGISVIYLGIYCAWRRWRPTHRDTALHIASLSVEDGTRVPTWLSWIRYCLCLPFPHVTSDEKVIGNLDDLERGATVTPAVDPGGNSSANTSALPPPPSGSSLRAHPPRGAASSQQVPANNSSPAQAPVTAIARRRSKQPATDGDASAEQMRNRGAEPPGGAGVQVAAMAIARPTVVQGPAQAAPLTAPSGHVVASADRLRMLSNKLAGNTEPASPSDDSDAPSSSAQRAHAAAAPLELSAPAPFGAASARPRRPSSERSPTYAASPSPPPPAIASRMASHPAPSAAARHQDSSARAVAKPAPTMLATLPLRSS